MTSTLLHQIDYHSTPCALGSTRVGVFLAGLCGFSRISNRPTQNFQPASVEQAPRFNPFLFGMTNFLDRPSSKLDSEGALRLTRSAGHKLTPAVLSGSVVNLGHIHWDSRLWVGRNNTIDRSRDVRPLFKRHWLFSKVATACQRHLMTNRGYRVLRNIIIINNPTPIVSIPGFKLRKWIMRSGYKINGFQNANSPNQFNYRIYWPNH